MLQYQVMQIRIVLHAGHWVRVKGHRNLCAIDDGGSQRGHVQGAVIQLKRNSIILRGNCPSRFPIPPYRFPIVHEFSQ